MPSASVSVYPDNTGDLLVAKLTGISAPVSLAIYRVGWVSTPSLEDHGWMGRFEIPVPNGATITGVKLAFQSDARSEPAFATIDRQMIGLLAPDGIWNALGGTFSSASYPTKSDVPWPERDYGFVLESRPAKWFGSAPAVSMASFASFAGGAELSFGEGLSATNAVTGLVSKFQNYLNTHGPLLRSGSVSGTDLPVAVCWYRAHAGLTSPNEYFASINSSSGPVPPVLTIAWSVVVGPMEGKASLEPVVSVGRYAVHGSSSGKGNVRPAAHSRGRIR